jgi:hypothetical protein
MPSLNKSVTGLNQLIMGSQPSLVDNWIFKGNAGLKKQYKDLNRFLLHSKIPHSITKMNDNINIDSTIAG